MTVSDQYKNSDFVHNKDEETDASVTICMYMTLYIVVSQL